jgi:lipid-binding SYLF domain-containing protein
MRVRLLYAFALGASLAHAGSDAADRLAASAQTFKEVMDTPDKSIPRGLLNRAQCIVIIPGLKKGAFVFGAKYGKGFLSCRNKDGIGWSAPGGVRVEGGSFGFQIGGEETDASGGTFHPSRDRRGADRGDPDLVAFARPVRRHLVERSHSASG